MGQFRGYTKAPKEIEESLDYIIAHKVKPIKGLIPAPEKLVLRQPDKEKITIAVDGDTLAFFKGVAKKYDKKYQTMMNDVLGDYAKAYSK
jgi:uncharacterized protein (DUF4415 family)